MLANIDFTIRYRTNPPSPPEDLKWILCKPIQIAEIKEQIIAEFPAADNQDFTEFYENRNYNLLTDDLWI